MNESVDVYTEKQLHKARWGIVSFGINSGVYQKPQNGNPLYGNPHDPEIRTETVLDFDEAVDSGMTRGELDDLREQVEAGRETEDLDERYELASSAYDTVEQRYNAWWPGNDTDLERNEIPESLPRRNLYSVRRSLEQCVKALEE